METRIFKSIRTNENMFKSYYVVWKLLEGPHTLQRVFLFKSYYVVWKQQPVFFQYQGADRLFPYYIVRFKPFFLYICMLSFEGFHTT